MRPRRLAEEAHGLPAESVVLHGNHERYKEAILILFAMTFIVLSQSLFQCFKERSGEEKGWSC
ncbi:hypothetical protein ASG66_12960 [Bacillus sp. Leaf406]|nr:hypothetical protein ASG66_12960 [Bacillus sp. Leaf406]